MSKTKIHDVTITMMFPTPLSLDETVKLVHYLESGFENSQWGSPVIHIELKYAGLADKVKEKSMTAKKLLEIEKEGKKS